MTARFAPLALVALLLAACSGAEDTSEDATADTVEMPADEAMADVPMPVEDRDFAEDDALDGAAAARAEPSTQAIERSAEQAADDAQSAVDDAIAAAETEME